ncbi:MAG TPA: hypothetical protein VFA50_08505 [Stellaceae bacterium]|nr:hypothetical protein [Stellaceae bacterium]
MNLVKPIASLSSDLLARKGSAQPAYLAFPFPAPPPRLELRTPPPTPEPARAAKPEAVPAPHGEGPVRLRARGGGRPPQIGSKAAKVSLRLDADRHQRLRLAALHLGRSGQQILTAALDAYLDGLVGTVMDGQCACLQPPAE